MQGQSERGELVIIWGLTGALILLILGTFALLLMGRPLPEFMNNIATLLAGGLLGYLGARRHQAPTVGNVAQGDVTVEAPAVKEEQA